MKIIIISRGDPFTTFAGTEILAGNISIELAKQGHEVDLIYGGRATGNFVSEPTNLNLHVLNIVTTPYLSAFDFRRKCAKRCVQLLVESDYDAVVALGAGTFPGYIFGKVKGKSGRSLLIYYAMDTMIMEYERSKASNEAKGLFASFQMGVWYTVLIRSDKTSCLNSDLILTSSKDTMKHLIADYGILPTKIKLLYEGVPDDFAVGYDVIDPSTPTFLHVAGGPRKGTAFFLKAMRLLKGKYGLNAKAVIIRASQSNIKQAETLGVECDAYRYVNTPELKRQYASCTAFVSPSLSEGFCLPIIEAAMFEKPSVVTNVGSLPELVINGETGFVVPVADVTTLTDRLYQIIINTEMRQKMGKNARKRAENFTVTNTASNFLTLIKEFKHWCALP